MTENAWIEHDGSSEMPVAGTDLVQVQFFDETREVAERSTPQEARFYYGSWEDDTIRSYRLSGPSA